MTAAEAAVVATMPKAAVMTIIAGPVITTMTTGDAATAAGLAIRKDTLKPPAVAGTNAATTGIMTIVAAIPAAMMISTTVVPVAMTTMIVVVAGTVTLAGMQKPPAGAGTNGAMTVMTADAAIPVAMMTAVTQAVTMTSVPLVGAMAGGSAIQKVIPKRRGAVGMIAAITNMMIVAGVNVPKLVGATIWSPLSVRAACKSPNI